MRIEQIVPWGRSFDEYARMFALTESDLGGRILGCGDGPASFNAEAAARGVHVVSCDPIYAFAAGQIEERIARTYETVLSATRERQGRFVWDEIPSVEALGQRRMASMRCFLADYRTPQSRGRYVAGALPDLPFATDTFELAVCSHLLFLYTEQMSAQVHVQSARELIRVAGEVRIFPLLDLESRASSHVEPVRRALEADGCRVLNRAGPV